MDPIQQVRQTFEILIRRNGGLTVSQLSVLVLNSTKYFDFSTPLKGSEAEKLLDLWTLFLEAKTIITLDLSYLAQQRNLLLSNDRKQIILNYLAFDVLLKISSQIFSSKKAPQPSTKATNSDFLKSAGSKNSFPLAATSDFYYFYSERSKALVFWDFLISRVSHIIIAKDTNSNSQQDFQLISTSEYFGQTSKINYIAYCICGVLDNIVDSTEFDVTFLALNILSNCLGNSVELLTYNQSSDSTFVCPKLKSKNYQSGILSSKKSLLQFFPGVASTLIKVALDRFDGSKNKNSETHSKNKAFCILLLAKSVVICFENKPGITAKSKDIDLYDPNSSPYSTFKYWSKESSKSIKDTRQDSIERKIESIDNINEPGIKSRDDCSSPDELIKGLKALLEIRRNSDFLVQLKLVQLFGNITSNCWIALYDIIPFALQFLFIMQDSEVQEIAALSKTCIESFANTLISEEYKSHSENVFSDLFFWFEDLWDQFPKFMNSFKPETIQEALILMANYSVFFQQLLLKGSKDSDCLNKFQLVKEIIHRKWESTILQSLSSFISNSNILDDSSNKRSIQQFGVENDELKQLDFSVQGSSGYDSLLKEFFLKLSRLTGLEYQVNSIFSAFSTPNSIEKYNYLYLLTLVLGSNDIKMTPKLIDSGVITSSSEDSSIMNRKSLLLTNQTIESIYQGLVDEIFIFFQAHDKSFSHTGSKVDLSVFGSKNHNQDSIHVSNALVALKYLLDGQKTIIYYYLEEILFPLVALSQVGTSIISATASDCLLTMACSLEYKSISELLYDNADYIVNACSSRIRQLDFSNGIFLVLTSVISALSLDQALDLTSDIVEDTLNTIELVSSDGSLFVSNPLGFQIERLELSSGFNKFRDPDPLNYSNDSSSSFGTVLKSLDFFIALTKKIRDGVVSDKIQIESFKKNYFDDLKNKINLKIKTSELEPNEDETDGSDIDNENKNMESQSTVSIANSTHIYAQKVCIKIMLVIKNLISHSNPKIQIYSLKIFQNILPCLVGSDELLPLINEVWPFISSSLVFNVNSNADQIYMALAALQLISDVSFYSGDWLRSRILTEIWPAIQSQLFKSLNAENRKYLVMSFDNSSTQLVLGYISTLENIFKHVPLSNKIYFDAACLLIHFFDDRLNREITKVSFRASKVLSRKEPDILWLVCNLFNDIPLKSPDTNTSVPNFTLPNSLRSCSNPFEADYPDFIEVVLEDEFAGICTFDKYGTMLATARSDGYCFVWDFLTLSIIRKYKYNSQALTCLSWSDSNEYLLVGNTAGECILWDLKDDSPFLLSALSTSINSVKILHKPGSFLVCPSGSPPCFIIHDNSNNNHNPSTSPTVIELKNKIGTEKSKNSKPMLGTSLAMEKTGKYIFMGTSSGFLCLIDSVNMLILDTARVCNSAITQISSNFFKSEVALNCKDRVIRIMNVDIKESEDNNLASMNLKLLNKIQDLINKENWSGAYFSSTGENIIVGSHRKADHNLYVWDKYSTNLIKILSGPGELMLHFDVHPFRPIVASVSDVGLIYVWTRTPQQNWSSFDIKFKDLDRNIDYEEPEDEFDEGSEGEVDVTTFEPLYGLDIGSPAKDFFYPTVKFDNDENS
ncbi:hypothetical protein BB560_006623 [Smittium megazygosporum]|uniref:TTI1 C-terminal TPR domain-containing protein n=1 Tax=Smittium megazygosporum TaxID=133381 RepID=A0A2T9Y2W9_9FUNG|nr:hypothetical protein BB560_006623 [Smittium megazygosporum]